MTAVGYRIHDVLGLCADPTRFEILCWFREKPEWNAGEIAGRFRLARATVSHHVNLLVRGGILAMRKEGQERWYSAGLLGICSGGCRPVVMGDLVREAGFPSIHRHYFANRSIFFLNKMVGSEIILARG